MKATLSEYLQRVKAGEEVIVTERGRAIARIVPLSRALSDIPSHLFELERSGLVRLGTGRLPKDFWNAPRPKDRGGLAFKMLFEERETGR